MEKVFNWKNSTIAYTHYGVGQKSIIAFHGYGQTKEMFGPFTEVFGQDYQIIAVDLPFHGNTVWKGKEMLDPAEVYAFSQAFLEHVNVQDRFSVLAYSIGGNYALSLASAFATRVDRLWLIAADGLKFKPGFWFITRTVLGKWLFKGFVQFPGPAIGLIKLLNFVGFYPDKLRQFFLTSISDKQKRIAIYKRWRSVSQMVRNQKEVLDALNGAHIRVDMYFGRYDKIIPLKNAVEFDRKLDYSRLVILEDGHQLLHRITYQKMKEDL